MGARTALSGDDQIGITRPAVDDSYATSDGIAAVDARAMGTALGGVQIGLSPPASEPRHRQRRAPPGIPVGSSIILAGKIILSVGV